MATALEIPLTFLLAVSLAADPRAITAQEADPDLGPVPTEGPRMGPAPGAATDPAAAPGDATPATPSAEGPAATPAPDSAALPVAAGPPGKCLQTRGQCRQLTITGAVFLSLGLAAVGTGIGLRLRANEPIEDEPAFEKSTHPPGVMLIGMGTGVLITGILMLVAGRRAHKLAASGQQAARVPGARLRPMGGSL